MRGTRQPCVLVPLAHRDELEALSKNALLDMVWSLAGQTVESAEDEASVIAKLREEWRIVKAYREPAAKARAKERDT